MRLDFAGRPDLPAALNIGEHVRVAVEQVPVEDSVDLGGPPLSTGEELEFPPELVRREPTEALLPQDPSTLRRHPAVQTELGGASWLHPAIQQRFPIHPETVVNDLDAGLIAGADEAD